MKRTIQRTSIVLAALALSGCIQNTVTRAVTGAVGQTPATTVAGHGTNGNNFTPVPKRNYRRRWFPGKPKQRRVFCDIDQHDSRRCKLCPSDIQRAARRRSAKALASDGRRWLLCSRESKHRIQRWRPRKSRRLQFHVYC